MYNATYNKALFLQSLDGDKNPDNGIGIPAAFLSRSASVSVDFKNSAEIKVGIGKIREDSYLADEIGLYSHYMKTLESLRDNCEYFSPFEATYDGVLEQELHIKATCKERYQAYAYDRIVYPSVLENWALKSGSMAGVMTFHDQVEQIIELYDVTAGSIFIMSDVDGVPLSKTAKEKVMLESAELIAKTIANHSDSVQVKLAAGILDIGDAILNAAECTKGGFMVPECIEVGVAAALASSSALNETLAAYFLNGQLEDFNEYQVADGVLKEMYKYGYKKKLLLENWQINSFPSYSVKELTVKIGRTLGLSEDKWYWPGDYERHQVEKIISSYSMMVDQFIKIFSNRQLGNVIKLFPATSINGNTTVNWKWNGLPGTRINPTIPYDISIKCYSEGSNYTFENPYKQTLVSGNLSGSFELLYQSAGNKKLFCVVDDIYGGLLDKKSISVVVSVAPPTCDASHLNLCSTESTCTGAGGYWWSNNTCNSTQESAPPGTVTSVGQVWMDRNLGASRVATSSTDTQAYGDLYQWGRGTDGHEKRNSATTSTLSSSDTPGHGDFITVSSSPYDWRTPQHDNLWQGVSGINNPCPAGFRLPTETELGTERQSWSSNDSAGAYGSPLKLVLASFRYHYDGTINDAGSNGHYWSSTVGGSHSRYLYFNSGNANMNSTNRAFGFSVRCLKD